MRLVTAAEMREIDRHAIETVGINSLILMENAGLKVLLAMEKALSGLRDKRFTVVCGKGNNGGDGLVVARHLFNNGVPVNVFIAAKPGDLSPDATKNVQILQNCGFQPVFMNGMEDLTKLRVTLEFSDCAIDALYGTGFSGQITGYYAEIVKILNESRTRKIAIDVPSGLCATTGALSDPVVRAEITITLGLPKLGMYLYPGVDAAGEIWVADIGIPQVSYEAVQTTAVLLTRPVAAGFMPVRPSQGHKGTFGHVLILAGSQEYQGAGILASYGSLRSGVGLVSLGLPEKVSGKLSCEVLPDVILRNFPEKDGGFALDENIVEEFGGVYETIVAGPGWGKGQIRRKSVEMLTRKWPGGLVLDADALNALSNSEVLENHPGNLILTPHLGEMSRLCGKSISEIKSDIINISREFAIRNKCVLVLKSAIPVIADQNGRILVCSRPNSGLARGGSGDLLAGLIGGLLAQGIPALKAASIGVFLHAEAAEIARNELGADAMTISEVASLLPRAFKRLRGEDREEGKN